MSLKIVEIFALVVEPIISPYRGACSCVVKKRLPRYGNRLRFGKFPDYLRFLACANTSAAAPKIFCNKFLRFSFELTNAFFLISNCNPSEE